MQFHKLKRREFITLLGGAAVTWPLAVRGQQAPRAARLGYLAPASNPDLQQSLLGGLRDLGYVEGQNLAIEYRFMLGQSKSYDELAAELARSAPDAMVVVGTPTALAAKRQTTTIPIIMGPAADPLRSGLVASLSSPGGNVTGVSLYGSEIARKRMEIFKEAVIGIQRIAVIANAENPLHRFLWDDLQPIGPALGLQFRFRYAERGHRCNPCCCWKSDHRPSRTRADDFVGNATCSRDAARALVKRLHLPLHKANDGKALVSVDLGEINHNLMPAHSSADQLPVAASLKKRVKPNLETTPASHQAELERERAERLMAELLRAKADALAARATVARLEGELASLRSLPLVASASAQKATKRQL